MQLIGFLALFVFATGYVRAVAVNGDCSAEGAVCDTDLTCQTTTDPVSAKCKVKIEATCAAAGECADKSTCGGDPKKCMCPANHVANAANTTCLAKIDETCTAAADCVDAGKSQCIGEASDRKCTCPAATHFASADKTKCLLKINQACSATVDCGGKSQCTGSPKKCTCLASQVPNADNTMCLVKIDQICFADAECVQGNSACVGRPTGECACDNNYMATDMNDACKKKLNVSCSASNECGVNAQCSGSPTKCTCKQGFENLDGRCGKKLGAACTLDTECPKTGECKAEKCACPAGYSADEEKACFEKKSRASGMLASLSLLAVVLMTSLLL